MIVAGIDEAGYGPLLGPLVVSAAAFRVCDPPAVTDPDAGELLWRRLRRAVARQGPVRDGKLIIADSKLVHRLADGLTHMERAVLTMCRLLPHWPGTAPTLFQLLHFLGMPPEILPEQAWYAYTDGPLPLFCQADGTAVAANMLRATMAAEDISLAALRTRVIDEGQFNRLLAATNNKAAVLTSATMNHLAQLHSQFGGEGLVAVVDKQSGRDRYVPLLLEALPGMELKVLQESRRESGYRLQDGVRQTTVFFREKSEQTCLATALASMLCKYIREAMMHAFNRWWSDRVPGLKSTAGYYQDGRRWLADVRGHLERLGVQTQDLVRAR